MLSDPSVRDWAYLPAGVEAKSLWLSLHDGKIRAIRSDRLAMSLTLEIEVAHLCHHHGLAEEPFLFELEGVKSSRATTWAIWPGPKPDTEGVSRAEQSRLIEEYWSKWREDSVGWADFEAMFGDGYLDIGDAEIVREAGVIALRASGMMYGDRVEMRAFEFITRGSGLAIRQGREGLLDLERFVQLGEDYWEAWSKG